jgi:hypothetical protein
LDLNIVATGWLRNCVALPWLAEATFDVIRETAMDNSAPVLTLPSAERVRFEKNFIKTAVCELRFPALLELEANPPVQLQKALKKDFPHYERQQSVGLTNLEKDVRHLLRSKLTTTPISKSFPRNLQC